MGELNDNKNHETILRAVSRIEGDNIYYIICGKGPKAEYLENLAEELGMRDRLILAGFRRDTAEIYKSCDIFAFPSKREGLPVALMEAMASGMPCVVSDIRGNTDLIKDGEEGLVCDAKKSDDFAEKIELLIKNKELRELLAKNSDKKIQEFSVAVCHKQMKEIYKIQ